jgi:hypothetical protein
MSYRNSACEWRPGLSIAAGSKMWNSRFREFRRDSSRKDSRFDGLQILLTWVLADKHYWTQLPAPSAKAPASEIGRYTAQRNRGTCRPIPPAAAATGRQRIARPRGEPRPAPLATGRRAPHSKMNSPSAQGWHKSQRYREEQTAAATWVRNAGALHLQCGRYGAQLNPRRHRGATQDAEG